MIYGIQARQSVRLTEVARALGEEISVKKTVERLSRQAGRWGLWNGVTERFIRMAASRIREDTLLVLDISDLSKKYAQKMEYLATVREGSEKTRARGYWTLDVIGTEVSNPRVIPLYSRLSSDKAPEQRGVWVLDRDGDRDKLFYYLLDRKLGFIIRLRGDRHLEAGRGLESAVMVAEECPTLFLEYVANEEEEKERPLKLEVGYRKVRLPGRPEILTLVVVRGFGQEPMILLTNLAVKRSRKSIWHVVAAYLSRWRVEETIRYLKQSYQLEDIRVLGYVRLQTMMALVIAAAYFASVYL